MTSECGQNVGTKALTRTAGMDQKKGSRTLGKLGQYAATECVDKHLHLCTHASEPSSRVTNPGRRTEGSSFRS